MRIQLPSPERSDFVRSLRMLATHDGIPLHLTGSLRALADDERDVLIANGNHCADWSRIRVAADFAPSLVVGCHLVGNCVLGISLSGQNAGRSAAPTSGEDGALRPGDGATELPVGIYHSTLVDAVIGDGARIYRCPLIRSTTVDRAATLMDVSVEGPRSAPAAETTDGEPPRGLQGNFGIGTVVTVGNETGGRPVPLFADLDLALATELAEAPGRGEADGIAPTIARYLADRVRETQIGCSYIGPEARVVRSTLRSVWIGPSAVIGPNTEVSEATVLSSREEPTIVGTDAHLERALVQWGAAIRSGALVSGSALLEHSECERRALVTSSIIGPNTHVAEGEVTSSLVGPFVALHHQSLLIAAVWPQGRGNISQGANVGSNHTGRAPDQEIRPGEGSFFGLDCAVKFPCNLSHAPYSIIATSTILAPQRIDMPFSLIAAPAEGTHGHNVLVPGWLLRHSAYTIERNDRKYRTRNRARRSAVDAPVMREEIAQLMDEARVLLDAEPVDDLMAWRTPDELAGTGICVVREKDRRAAITAYRDAAEMIRLGAQLDAAHREASEADAAPDTGSSDRRPATALTREERSRYHELVSAWRDQVRQSRGRDGHRGRLVFDDYDSVHPDVDHDAIIAAVDEWAAGRLAMVAEG